MLFTNLRIFADSDDRVNLSAFDVQAELLVISQFTLYANTRRGRRPSFTEAAQPDEAGALFQRAGEVPPKNTSRDVNTAVKKRLIAEDAGNPGCYRITKTGEKSISRTET